MEPGKSHPAFARKPRSDPRAAAHRAEVFSVGNIATYAKFGSVARAGVAASPLVRPRPESARSPPYTDAGAAEAPVVRRVSRGFLFETATNLSMSEVNVDPVIETLRSLVCWGSRSKVHLAGAS